MIKGTYVVEKAGRILEYGVVCVSFDGTETHLECSRQEYDLLSKIYSGIKNKMVFANTTMATNQQLH